MPPEPQFGTRDSDLMRVTIATSTLLIEGYIHLPKTGKEDRRLTNLLNTERTFIPLTNVVIYDRATNTRQLDTHPLIEININSIEYVKPHM